MGVDNAYVNPAWKWVVSCNLRDAGYINGYGLHQIKSFRFYGAALSPFTDRWNIQCSSNAKIYNWILCRLNTEQVTWRTLKMTGAEVADFLDDLDKMMEVLYGPTHC